MAQSPEVPSTFASMLSKCHAMTSIKIVMSEPEITLDDLAKHALVDHRYVGADNIQPGVRVQQRRRNCLAHFMSLLKAVYSSGRIISELVAIDLLEEILSNISYEADIMKGVFFPLQHLDLRISEFPSSNWMSPGRSSYFRRRNLAAMTLRKLLDEPNDLQRLSLSFPGREAEFSFELLERTSLDHLPQRWLPGLKQLGLSHFLAIRPDFKHLLEDATSLKSLTLREATLENGSMIDLLMALRGLKLEEICIDGRWVIDDDIGEWHSHGEADFSGCEFYDGPYDVKGLRHEIESYIINGGECPLPEIWEYGCGERVKGDASWHWVILGARQAP